MAEPGGYTMHLGTIGSVHQQRQRNHQRRKGRKREVRKGPQAAHGWLTEDPRGGRVDHKRGGDVWERGTTRKKARTVTAGVVRRGKGTDTMRPVGGAIIGGTH